MNIEGGYFPIQPDKRVEPIESSSPSNDRRPRAEKPPRRRGRLIDLEQSPEEEETIKTDTVEISEASQQAYEAYKESQDTEEE